MGHPAGVENCFVAWLPLLPLSAGIGDQNAFTYCVRFSRGGKFSIGEFLLFNILSVSRTKGKREKEESGSAELECK